MSQKYVLEVLKACLLLLIYYYCPPPVFIFQLVEFNGTLGLALATLRGARFASVLQAKFQMCCTINAAEYFETCLQVSLCLDELVSSPYFSDEE